MAAKSKSPIGSAHSAAMARNARKSAAYRTALKELRPKEDLARLIIHKRMELELTQEEVAKRMETTPSVISRLESGNHQMTLETLKRVAAALEQRLVVGFVGEDVVESETSGELVAV